MKMKHRLMQKKNEYGPNSFYQRAMGMEGNKLEIKVQHT